MQAAPRTPIATDLALLLDTSPSMLGSPRNRVGAAVASLLAVAPPGSRVSAVAFATRPEVLSLGDPASDTADASAVAIETLVDASARELGRSTRLDRALERAIGTQALETTNARRRKAVVLLSDARVSAELSLERATRLLRRRRIPLFVANLGDQVPSPALRHLASETGGAVLTLGAAAEAVVRGLSPAALEERVLAVFQDVARRRTTIRVGPRTWPLGPLHAGQALTWVGPVGHRRARIAGVRTTRGDPEWLVDWTDAGVHPWAALPESTPATTETECDPHGPAVREGGLGNYDTPIALAAERRCDVQSAAPRAPSTARDGRGIPAETLLRSLRERVIPRARQCLRRDRAGRARHSVRAVYEFELAHREVESVRVSGEIEDGLRACLEETLDGLEVPTFTGRIVVTYPVYTEAEAPPPRVELRSEVAHDVDDAIGPRIELNSLLTPEGQLTP